MSGIEIVGIILGALPLVIKGCAWYYEGVQPMKDYCKYGPALKALETRLSIQAVVYQDNIKRLLISSEVTAEEVHVLFNNIEPWKFTEAWQSGHLAEKLRNKLGPQDFSTFLSAVTQIDILMTKLMDKLKLDSKGKPICFPEGAAASNIAALQPRLGYEWRRISRTFSINKQSKLIEEFKEYNNAISSFVLNKEILSPQNSDSIIDAKSLVQYFDLIRKEAHSLYETLKSNWECSCKYPHNANLQLSFRGTETCAPVFEIYFSSQADGCSMTWRRTRVLPGPRTGEATQVQKRSILCKALCGVQKHSSINEPVWSSLEWQINAETEEPSKIAMSTAVHLRSLLAIDHAASKRSKRFAGLSEKQRRQIAVALSYSVLQFYDSPWMHDLWGDEDIYFFAGTNQFKAPEISDPCFSRTFPREHATVLDSVDQMRGHFLDVHIPNKPLFALGIVLLELCLNMTFDELHDLSGVDSSQPDAVDKYTIMEQNLERAYDTWGEAFGQVVQRCLNPEFGLRPSQKRMDFDKFREQVYTSIVAPLEEDLKLFM